MSRELLLMRHAKSDWNHPSLIDFDRPLNKRGQASAPKVGHWLRSRNLLPDRVVSSPAVRTRQTASLICAELGFAIDNAHWDMRIYEATLADLLTVLADNSGNANRMLLIGHNPGLEYLLAHLSSTTDSAAGSKLMPTATVAHLRLPDDWHKLPAGCGQLLVLQRPRELPCP